MRFFFYGPAIRFAPQPSTPFPGLSTEKHWKPLDFPHDIDRNITTKSTSQYLLQETKSMASPWWGGTSDTFICQVERFSSFSVVQPEKSLLKSTVWISTTRASDCAHSTLRFCTIEWRSTLARSKSSLYRTFSSLFFLPRFSTRTTSASLQAPAYFRSSIHPRLVSSHFLKWCRSFWEHSDIHCN